MNVHKEQVTGKNSSNPNSDGTTYTKYCGHVYTLQDQADSGGWLRGTIGGDEPDHQVMGTRD